MSLGGSTTAGKLTFYMILGAWQVNEEASDKVLEVEQKYNEIRRPVYNKRNEIIKGIPDFWLTAVCIHPLVYLLLLSFERYIYLFYVLLLEHLMVEIMAINWLPCVPL